MRVQPEVDPRWLTPSAARETPIHRWFVFPHSYSPELVEWLLGRMDLEPGARILDPFCGAGTTLVEAQRLGFSAVGIDLLPLSVLVSRAKTSRPSPRSLRRAGDRALGAVRVARPAAPPGPILDRALDPRSYGLLRAALHSTPKGPAGDCVRLATLSLVRRFSKLVADGGWLRRCDPALGANSVVPELEAALLRMEADLSDGGESPVTVSQADVRRLPIDSASVDAVITSPPYPNRHDYTRVFGVELELAFGLGDGVFDLRRQAIQSHPEAKPSRIERGYEPPPDVSYAVEEVAARHRDSRIPAMLAGYFRDLYDVLVELHRVLRTGGQAALAVGNAQYCGVPIAVDRHLATIAERVGFEVGDVITGRLRGNSAQQMKGYGRRPSRESVVQLLRP